ncbi:hypothetical protein IWZ01DRAFT_541444 [Phyllosticta capitalensis]
MNQSSRTPAKSDKMASEGGGPTAKSAEKSSDHGILDNFPGTPEAPPPAKKRKTARPESASSKKIQKKDERQSVNSSKTKDPVDPIKAPGKAFEDKLEGMARALQATKAAQVAKLKKIEGLEKHHAALTKLYAGAVAVQEACEAFPELDDIDLSIDIIIRSGDDLKDWDGAFKVLEEAFAKLNTEG